MTIEDLKQHSIGILGFGQEGQAILAYLKKHNLQATVFENDSFDEINKCTLLFRSPGIWRKHPRILEAEEKGTIITSQTKWFFEHTSASIIGVTGTKGKGTTSSLIYETLKASGKNVFLTGNIGKVQPLELLDNITSSDIIVFELSSFQLQDITISPHIAVCLMVTSDHLDHHANLEEYHAAKKNITKFQNQHDSTVFNIDYPATVKIGEAGRGNKLQISSKQPVKLGATISGNSITIKTSGIEFTMDCTSRNLRGAHNLENIAAAALATISLGVDPNIISQSCLAFTGLEHRLQFVGTFEEVSYYNDSISTVPETAIAALKAFSEPIHLILGGSEKGLNYDQLISVISETPNLASVTLLGEVGNRLLAPLTDRIQIPLLGPFTEFETAVTEIKKHTRAGDVVLLSPAAASFDMFKNYADRGHQFVTLVSE